MKYLNISVVLGVCLLSLGATQALAFQKVIPFSIPNPKIFAREAIRIDSEDKTGLLAPSRLEIVNKDNLIELKLKDPTKFDQIRSARLENSVLYQSWVDEIYEALSHRRFPSSMKNSKTVDYYQKYFAGTPIDMAKRIAAKQLYLAIQHTWPWIKDTIFNDYGAETWKRRAVVHSPEAPLQADNPGGSDLTVEKIKELFHFSPKLSSDKYYVFAFEFGGPSFVEINKKTLKVGRVGLDIDSDHDVNRLEKGADKITAVDSDDNSGHSTTGNSDNDSSNMNNSLPPPGPQDFPAPQDDGGGGDIMY